MPSLTAEKSLGRVQSSTESIRNDEPQRFSEAASIGDIARQGDIYIEKLAKVPDGAEVDKEPSAQLAPGTTQGSRHVLDSLDGVVMYRLSEPTPLQGPVLDLAHERTITHPEHGNVILPPGIYGVTYQRAFGEEIKRVAD